MAQKYIFFSTNFANHFLFYYKKAEFDAVGDVKYYDPSEITFRQTLTRKAPESNRWEEVELYGADGKKLAHKRVFSSFKPSLYFPGNTAEKLFDGDVLTFFHTSDSLAWGAVELPEPSAVSKIRFKIRNDEVVWR